MKKLMIKAFIFFLVSFTIKQFGVDPALVLLGVYIFDNLPSEFEN